MIRLIRVRYNGVVSIPSIGTLVSLHESKMPILAFFFMDVYNNNKSKDKCTMYVD